MLLSDNGRCRRGSTSPAKQFQSQRRQKHNLRLNRLSMATFIESLSRVVGVVTIINSNDAASREGSDKKAACSGESSPPAQIACDAARRNGATSAYRSRRQLSQLLGVASLALVLLASSLFGSSFFQPLAVEAVDCFKCSSRNGSNPACEDPFHNLNTSRVTSPILPEPSPDVIYHTPCYAGKKGREGLFPASACIKLTGTFDATGETLVVRHCALDSGTLTQDTELARMSHCGKFQFEGDLLRGCVLACPEDACNGAAGLKAIVPPLISVRALGSLATVSSLLLLLRMSASPAPL